MTTDHEMTAGLANDGNGLMGTSCPICDIRDSDCLLATDWSRMYWEKPGLGTGRIVVALRRHVLSLLDATETERVSLFDGIASARLHIEAWNPPDGYEIRLNSKADVTWPMPHLHALVIPRFSGVDLERVLGQVSSASPAATHSVVLSRQQLPHVRALISGGADPLLPHLIAHLATALRVDIIVAFAMASGVRLIEEHLRDVLARNGRVRILTGDYLSVTEPEALFRLLDLGPRLELRAFVCAGQSFHPKSYLIIDHDGSGTALVGSSNLSQTALRNGIEWNYRIIRSSDETGFHTVQDEFELTFKAPQTVAVDVTWIESYAARRLVSAPINTGVPEEPFLPPPSPHEIQREALDALRDTRKEGNAAGLVVLATGLGKTWLSAFDADQAGACRILFVAHREEILDQAMRTFRAIRPRAVLGKYTGTERTIEADVTFASIQALSRRAHLSRFAPDTFDYIIVDEFHHASAASYRRLLDHFTPAFLLGLTATPARTDGADLLALCGDNQVYSCDLARGIRRGLLAPFDYYGVPDDVDYANIPWRNGRFDEDELTTRVSVKARAGNALDQLQRRGGKRTLAFCVSQRHADFMRQYFIDSGLRVAAVHSGSTSDPRARSLELLQAGDIDVLFAVDMFNEGVDLPDVDTILMLRPTESAVLWLQQFGRGLRYREGKRLRVIDYIGNHRSFLLKPRTLFQLGEGTAEIANALRLVDEGGEATLLPPGCHVTYDLEAKEILRALLARDVDRPQALKSYYEDFREQNGVRPTASEAFQDGYDPRAVRVGYGTWLQFVRTMGDLTAADDEAEVRLRPLLSWLEAMPVRRSDAMLTVLAAIAEEAFPGRLPADRLVSRVRVIARRSAAIRRDLGELLENEEALKSALLGDAVKDWAEVKGPTGFPYLAVDGGSLVASTFLRDSLSETAAELIREVAEWRLAAYMHHASQYVGAPRIFCKVSHSGDRPILFLPSRDNPGIPEGWVDVTADGNTYHAKFAKIAVNVMQRPESDENVLPALLQGWFGPDAGRSGTAHRVVFERSANAYTIAPSRPEDDKRPQLWSRYARSDIPTLFGITLSSFDQQMGVVERPGVTLLFVTLDKKEKLEAHRYKDEFLSATEFQWQSQNRTKRSSDAGKRLQEHEARNITVQLFVRAKAKIRGKTQSFLYCGSLRFERWEGDNPITVWWTLGTPVPDELRSELQVPTA